MLTKDKATNDQLLPLVIGPLWVWQSLRKGTGKTKFQHLFKVLGKNDQVTVVESGIYYQLVSVKK